MKCLREEAAAVERGGKRRDRLVGAVVVEPAFGCAIAPGRRGPRG